MQSSFYPSNAAEVWKEHKIWDHQANFRAMEDKQQKYKYYTQWWLIINVFYMFVLS